MRFFDKFRSSLGKLGTKLAVATSLFGAAPGCKSNIETVSPEIQEKALETIRQTREEVKQVEGKKIEEKSEQAVAETSRENIREIVHQTPPSKTDSSGRIAPSSKKAKPPYADNYCKPKKPSTPILSSAQREYVGPLAAGDQPTMPQEEVIALEMEDIEVVKETKNKCQIAKAKKPTPPPLPFLKLQSGAWDTNDPKTQTISGADKISLSPESSHEDTSQPEAQPDPTQAFEAQADNKHTLRTEWELPPDLSPSALDEWNNLFDEGEIIPVESTPPPVVIPAFNPLDKNTAIDLPPLASTQYTIHTPPTVPAIPEKKEEVLEIAAEKTRHEVAKILLMTGLVLLSLTRRRKRQEEDIIKDKKHEEYEITFDDLNSPSSSKDSKNTFTLVEGAAAIDDGIPDITGYDVITASVSETPEPQPQIPEVKQFKSEAPKKESCSPEKRTFERTRVFWATDSGSNRPPKTGDILQERIHKKTGVFNVIKPKLNGGIPRPTLIMDRKSLGLRLDSPKTQTITDELSPQPYRLIPRQ